MQLYNYIAPAFAILIFEQYENTRRDVRKKRARIRDIHAMLKKERNRRVAAETENDKLHDKVNSLTKHIEKLMSALRVR